MIVDYPSFHSNTNMGSQANRYVLGYPSLAADIASDTDKSSHIYRRFERLSARNLLHLQSEVAVLESRLDQLDKNYLIASTTEKQSARSWEILCSRAEQPENLCEKERLDKILQVRQKIKEYRPYHSRTIDCRGS